MGGIRQIYHALAALVLGDGERRARVVDAIDILLPLREEVAEPCCILRRLAGDNDGSAACIDARVCLQLLLWLRVGRACVDMLVVELIRQVRQVGDIRDGCVRVP